MCTNSRSNNTTEVKNKQEVSILPSWSGRRLWVLWGRQDRPLRSGRRRYRHCSCCSGCCSSPPARTHTRDVHYVTSAALPFANYISHIVETCIRRNFKSSPITMYKISFDVISHVDVRCDKNTDVINSAWRKWIPKLSNFVSVYSHRWSWETIAWKPTLIWHVYMEPTAFRAALFADGLRDSELERSVLTMVTVRVVQVLSGTRKLCLWWRNLPNKIHTWLFLKDAKDVAFQLAQLRELCAMISTWKNNSWQDGCFIS